VQVSTNMTGGFSDLSPDIIAIGTGTVFTNYVDSGALTNLSPRFYRVRQPF